MYLDAFVLKKTEEKGEGIHVAEYTHASARDAGGIVCFSSPATRHCNNSKTAILFPRASSAVRRIRLEMHVRGGSLPVYITDAVVVRSR